MNQPMREDVLGSDPRWQTNLGNIDEVAAGYRPQVLVVDDVWDNRRIIMRHLSRRRIDCTEADGSVEALKLLAKKAFDLVLLDIMMPGMDGSEFMQVVRDKYSQSELPIIMVTARGSSDDIKYNFGLGANDYIVKPLDWATAFPRIMAQINRKLDTDQRSRAYAEVEAETGKLREAITKNSETLVRMSLHLAHGLDASGPLRDDDLLELLLSTTIPQCETRVLAHRLLAKFGDLGSVIAAPERRLLEVAGATDRVHLMLKLVETAALRMARARVMGRCAIASWDDLLRYCKTVMAHRENEQVRVLYLDRKNVIIADEAQGQGTVDHVPVYPREIVRRALELNASAVILVHNHPSGDPEPSDEDVAMTTRIAEACATVGVTVHDHLVIGKDRDASLRAMGLM